MATPEDENISWWEKLLKNLGLENVSGSLTNLFSRQATSPTLTTVEPSVVRQGPGNLNPDNSVLNYLDHNPPLPKPAPSIPPVATPTALPSPTESVTRGRSSDDVPNGPDWPQLRHVMTAGGVVFAPGASGDPARQLSGQTNSQQAQLAALEASYHATENRVTELGANIRLTQDSIILRLPEEDRNLLTAIDAARNARDAAVVSNRSNTRANGALAGTAASRQPEVVTPSGNAANSAGQAVIAEQQLYNNLVSQFSVRHRDANGNGQTPEQFFANHPQMQPDPQRPSLNVQLAVAQQENRRAHSAWYDARQAMVQVPQQPAQSAGTATFNMHDGVVPELQNYLTASIAQYNHAHPTDRINMNNGTVIAIHQSTEFENLNRAAARVDALEQLNIRHANAASAWTAYNAVRQTSALDREIEAMRLRQNGVTDANDAQSRTAVAANNQTIQRDNTNSLLARDGATSASAAATSSAQAFAGQGGLARLEALQSLRQRINDNPSINLNDPQTLRGLSPAEQTALNQHGDALRAHQNQQQLRQAWESAETQLQQWQQNLGGFMAPRERQEAMTAALAAQTTARQAFDAAIPGMVREHAQNVAQGQGQPQQTPASPTQSSAQTSPENPAAAPAGNQNLNVATYAVNLATITADVDRVATQFQGPGNAGNNPVSGNGFSPTPVAVVPPARPTQIG